MVADVLMLPLFVACLHVLLQLGFLLTSVWAYTLQSSSLALYLGQSEVLALVISLILLWMCLCFQCFIVSPGCYCSLLFF